MQTKPTLVVSALALATMAGALGGSILSSRLANAADTTLSATATTQPNAAQNTQPSDSVDQRDETKAMHVGANGFHEALLTGDTADQVKAAALAAIPGGTIQRVETDAEGSPYEAHMTKSDGSRVTVKVDNNFKVTSTEEGPSGRGRMKRTNTNAVIDCGIL